MTAWIKMLSNQEASENLTNLFNLVKTPHGTVDNIMRIHSLRPNTMKGHYTLYKSVLHDKENCIPTWLQETISSYVSILNNCEYSFANHWKNAEYLINDKKNKTIIVKKNFITAFNIMPMSIFNCRTRLFLAIIQQRTILGGAPTLRFQEEPMNYTLIPHQTSVQNPNM